MNLKLIKISDFYYLISDGPCLIGDYVINTLIKDSYDISIAKRNYDNSFDRYYKKIIASNDNSIPNVQKLSSSNCEEIRLGFNIDKIVDLKFSNLSVSEENIRYFREGFMECLKIASEKKYTETEVSRLMRKIKNGWFDVDYNKHISSVETYDWEVKCKMDISGECKGNDDNGCFLDSPGHNYGCMSSSFSLDEDGCLILKRI